MINHLKIKDFAIIEEAEISFNAGLNIITGETGAGKSVMVEAISLALGSRADTSFIRSGKEKAVIQMIATLDDREYIISREINISGKNICKIDGEIVPLSFLTQLTKKIADIHGQYDHQALLHPENHITFIDAYHQEIIAPLIEDVALIYREYKRVSGRLQRLMNNNEEMERSRDFMKYQLEEIRTANLITGEDEELLERKNLLQNGEKIFQGLNNTCKLVNGGDIPSLDNIYKGMLALKDISIYSDKIKDLEEEYTELYYRLEDLHRETVLVRDSISYSESELEAVLERLDLLNTLKKKYGPGIEEILVFADSLQAKIDAVENFDDLKEELEVKLEALKIQLLEKSSLLTEARKVSAEELEHAIENELKELGFQSADLNIKFEEAYDFQERGKDIVEFLILTNKGDVHKALAKIASGGEMSRIMLAFKKIIADYDEIPTMIFDEIDSGISGVAASIVGKKLKQIARNHQIICITHLPQIAASGNYNFRIEKEETDSTTITRVLPLNLEEKISEIARLLGGETVTSTTLKSAEELIEASQ